MSGKAIFNYRVLVFAVLVIFSLLSLLIVVANHYCYRTFAFDFAHFRVSPSPLYFPDYPITFLQDHFSLTIVLLSPLYWLLAWLTGSYTLLVIQWLFIVSGAWATYKLVAFKSQKPLMGLLSLIYFFVLFGRYSSGDADCNLAIIGASTIPVFLYFFETRKTLAAVLTFSFLLVTREDYSLWLIFISLFLLVLHRKDKEQRQKALLFLIAAVVFLVLIFKVFIPALEDENKKYTLFEFSALGSTPFEALGFMFAHPLRTIELLFINHSGDKNYDMIKAEFYIMYLLAGGFILFSRPLYLIPFIPLIAKKMFADSPMRWSVEAYYSIEVVSLLPVMVFGVLSSFKNNKLKYFAGACICILTAFLTVKKFYTEPRMWGFGGSSKFNFLSPSFYKPLYNVSEVNEALGMIPGTAAICASGRMTPHLAFREKIYCYPKVKDASYIFLFKHDDSFPLSNEEFDKQLKDRVSDPEWKIIADKPDFILFERK